MKKIEFIKSYKGISFLINDRLFANDKIRIEKLVEILKLFSVNHMFLKSNCFVDEDENFIDEMKTLLECEVKIEFTKTRLFSKKKYSKIQISFMGELLSKAIEFIVQKDISIGVECYNADNTLALQFVVNDNDGACITFNSKVFNAEEIKSKVKGIIQ